MCINSLIYSWSIYLILQGDAFIDIQDQYYRSTPADLEEGIKAGRKRVCDGISVS